MILTNPSPAQRKLIDAECDGPKKPVLRLYAVTPADKQIIKECLKSSIKD